jgi:hypothetical protein
MGYPAKALAVGLLVWFALLMALVMVRVLRGDIRTAGFLSSTARPSDGSVDPERVLAMAVFPFIIVIYIPQALSTDIMGVATRPSMPDVSDFFVTLLTGSNGLYLAGKIARR